MLRNSLSDSPSTIDTKRPLMLAGLDMNNVFGKQLAVLNALREAVTNKPKKTTELDLATIVKELGMTEETAAAEALVGAMAEVASSSYGHLDLTTLALKLAEEAGKTVPGKISASAYHAVNAVLDAYGFETETNALKHYLGQFISQLNAAVEKKTGTADVQSARAQQIDRTREAAHARIREEVLSRQEQRW